LLLSSSFFCNARQQQTRQQRRDFQKSVNSPFCA
jgi:hypothetical protein